MAFFEQTFFHKKRANRLQQTIVTSFTITATILLTLA